MWLVLYLYYRKEWAATFVCKTGPETQPDPALTRLVWCSLVILIGLAVANIAASLITGAIVIPLPLIGLAAALPILVLSSQRLPVPPVHRLVHTRLFCRDVCPDGCRLADRLFPVSCPVSRG